MRVSSIDIVAGRAGMFYPLPAIGLRSFALKDGRTAHLFLVMLFDFHAGVMVRVYNDED